MDRPPDGAPADLRERTWVQLSRAAFLRGTFVLSSGRTSHFYIDKYLFETRPEVLRDVARLLAASLPRETTRLAGPALGGVPLATAVALETGLPFVIVRSEAKDHGTARTVEGTLSSGDRVVVLEDIVTTGGQAVRAARAIEAAGGQVIMILAVVDRNEGGRESVQGAGYRFQALYDLREWSPPGP